MAGKPLNDEIKRYSKNHSEFCTEEGCSSKYYAVGFCEKCYQKMRKEVYSEYTKNAKKRYYERNKEKILAEKRKRYADDHEFRERLKETVRRSHHKNKFGKGRA